MKNGTYNGIITKIEKNTITKKTDNTKFDVFVARVDIKNEKNEVKNLRFSQGMQYALEYFRDKCGVASKDMIGKPCKCTVITKESRPDEDGNTFKFNEIKYLNLFDEDGNVIKRRDVAETADDNKLW